MATAATNGLLPSIRTVACAMLFLALRVSHVLDKPFPALGTGTRRLILFLWTNVTSRLSARVRGRLRGDAAATPGVCPDPDRRPVIAPESIDLPPRSS